MRTREEHALAARTGAGQHQSDEHEAGQTLRGGHFLYGVGDEWLRPVGQFPLCGARRRERRPFGWLFRFRWTHVYMDYFLTHTADMNER